MHKNFILISLTLVMILLLTLAGSVFAAESDTFPKIIPLPDGFQPEGIATGRGSAFFAGSLAGGAIYAGDLRTGMGEVIVPAQADRTALGLAVDKRTNYLFVAGGPFGTAYVYDGHSGDTLAVYQLTDAPFFTTVVNDVIITRDAAYFTDSFRPYIYKLPLGPGGSLPEASAIEEIELTGDFEFEPGAFNANGIEATSDGKTLVIVQSDAGKLYNVDPETGYAGLIDLGGEIVVGGDGILLYGHTLYVVQNFTNQIAVVELSPELSSGVIVDTITDADFRIPTTVAGFGETLVAVNARFDVAPPFFPAFPPVYPEVEFEAVQISRH